MEPRGVGELGEEVAVRLLESRGYNILCRNYRTKHGEIDIVAEGPDAIVFVEVKTRRSLAFGQPFESVTYRKRRHLVDAARRYIGEVLCGGPREAAGPKAGPRIGKAVRFDVVSVEITGMTASDGHGPTKVSAVVTHIENAFSF